MIGRDVAWSTSSRLSAVLAVLALAWACGDDGPTTPPPVPDPSRPTTVTVSPPTVEVTALGATVQLTAAVRDQNNSVMAGTTLTWTSSDSSVATVDSSGLVTTAGNGTATVTATVGGVSGTASVTVTQSVHSVEVLPAEVELNALGATVQLTAEAFDANGHTVVGVEFSWTSSDSSVATVDAEGLVTAVAEGDATIQAASGAAEGTSQVSVVRPAGVVELAETIFSAPEGGRITAPLTISGPLAFPITVAYGLAPDADPETPDADGRDYHDAGAGSIEIPAGETQATIEVLVSEDGDIEPPRESLVLTLAAPGSTAGYSLGHTTAASLFIEEGVCDRTPQIRDKLVDETGSENCQAVTAPLLAGLTELNLRALEIAALEELDFTELTRLTQLLLDSNPLTELPPGVFAPLVRLYSLALGISPELRELPPGLFSPLSDLVNLSIYNTGMSALPPGIFQNLGNLELLILDNNRLERLPPEVFSGLGNLRELRLRGNRLSELPRLSDLSELESLLLDNNELVSLPSRAFSGLSSLREIALPYNRLRELPDGLFSDVDGLERLDFSFNPGAPFALDLELARTDTDNLLAPGPATIALTLDTGAPFPLSVPVLAPGAELSSVSLTIGPGQTTSEQTTVTPAGSARAAQVGIVEIPAVPAGFLGVEIHAGDPIVLFGEDSNRWPAVKTELPHHVLQAGGVQVRLDLDTYFEDPDRERLVYSASPGSGQVVTAIVEGNILMLNPVGDGETTVVVGSEDSGGLAAYQRMPVTVLRTPDSTGFHIDLVFTGAMLPAERASVRRAAERWGRIIVADVPDVPVSGGKFSCGRHADVALHATIDDLLVFVTSSPIAGGKALAAVCGLREESALPHAGYTVFDPDLLPIEGAASFESVAVHELAHTLGFGTVWWQKGLLRRAEGGALHFTGPLAIEAYDAAGGTRHSVPKVPVSPDEGHWYRPVEWEIMTGYRGGRNDPLSAITIQSIADLGYDVDVSLAEAYRLPDPRPAANRAGPVDSLSNDIESVPIVVIDRAGRVSGVIRESQRPPTGALPGERAIP